jgi:hypothetical protein
MKKRNKKDYEGLLSFSVKEIRSSSLENKDIIMFYLGN